MVSRNVFLRQGGQDIKLGHSWYRITDCRPVLFDWQLRQETFTRVAFKVRDQLSLHYRWMEYTCREKGRTVVSCGVWHGVYCEQDTHIRRKMHGISKQITILFGSHPELFDMERTKTYHSSVRMGAPCLKLVGDLWARCANPASRTGFPITAIHRKK